PIEVIVEMQHLLMGACAVDACQWFMTGIGINVQAASSVATLLQQTQAVPGELGPADKQPLRGTLLLGDASSQGVVVHGHYSFAPGAQVTDLNQPMFGIVAKPLNASPVAALFDQSAETVVAVVLVLIAQQAVMTDRWLPRPVEQVG